MRTAILADVPSIGPGIFHHSPHHSDLIGERRLGIVSLVPRGRALFWQGDQQAQNIEILHGVVRAVHFLKNGDRRVLAFFWPGDILRPVQASCQHYTAEAVTPCRVARSSAARAMCTGNEPCGAHQVLDEMLSLIMTGQKKSTARIAWFLMRIRRHLPSDPKRSNALRLLLPRADIADHLGTSLETVCRTLINFKSRGLIDLPNRKTIRFIDLKGLSLIAES